MKRFRICLSLIIVAIFAPCLFGQEIVGIQEVNPGMRMLIRRPDSSVIVTNLDDLARIGSFANPKNFQLLENPKILENVELSESQKKRLADVRSLSKKKSMELSAELKKKLSNETSEAAKLKVANEYVIKWRDFTNEISKELGEDLIPFQSKLIDRYNFQQSKLRNGLGQTLLEDSMAKELEIRGKQKQQIERLNKEMAEEIRKQVAKVRADTAKKIKKLLDEKQMKIIDELEKPLKNQ